MFVHRRCFNHTPGGASCASCSKQYSSKITIFK